MNKKQLVTLVVVICTGLAGWGGVSIVRHEGEIATNKKAIDSIEKNLDTRFAAQTTAIVDAVRDEIRKKER